MAIQHNPLDLSKQYLGPRALSDAKRYVDKFSSNLAPSYVPATIFRDSQENLKKNVETWKLRRPVNKDLWTDIAPDLRNHIDCRIQLFFQQLMLVYKTKLSFASYERADFQAGGKGMQGAEGKYVAAHDSTLPTLRLAQETPSDHSVSFGKNSYAYWWWNTTTYLPETANHIDSAIDRSFREKAFKILNKVSAGEMTPLAGLDDFLSSFLNRVSSLKATEDNHERLFVMNVYENAAKAYYPRVSDDSLPELLCNRNGPVNEYFYMAAQSEMHKEFLDEMLPLKPRPIKIPTCPPDISWIDLTNAVEDVIKTGVVHPGVTGMIYKKSCMLSANVRVAASTFFVALHPLSPSERQKKISGILRAPEAALFRKTVEDEISQAFYVSPKGLDAILLFILKDVGSFLSNFEKTEPKALEAPTPEIREESKEEPDNGLAPPPIVIAQKKLKKTLQDLAKEYRLTDTVTKSLTISKQSQAVRDVAKKYLQHLCTLSEPLQQTEIENIRKIKMINTVDKIGLSEKAHAVYKAVRKEIVEVGKRPEPRTTMPAVLFHLFNDLF